MITVVFFFPQTLVATSLLLLVILIPDAHKATVLDFLQTNFEHDTVSSPAHCNPLPFKEKLFLCHVLITVGF